MLIDEERGRLPVKRMCGLAQVARSTYYKWFYKIPAEDRDFHKSEPLKEIEAIVSEFSGYDY